MPCVPQSEWANVPPQVQNLGRTGNRKARASEEPTPFATTSIPRSSARHQCMVGPSSRHQPSRAPNGCGSLDGSLVGDVSANCLHRSSDALVLVGEIADYFARRSSSSAKKDDALFKISFAPQDSASSATRSPVLCLEIDAFGRHGAVGPLLLRTQTPRFTSFNPSSFTARAIAPSAVLGRAWS